MGSTRTNGLIIAVIGIILACCLCPLVANYGVILGTSFGSARDIVNIYSRFIPERVTLVIFAQLTCAFLLAVLAAIFGVVISRSKAV